jgi:hypothetical protein
MKKLGYITIKKNQKLLRFYQTGIVVTNKTCVCKNPKIGWVCLRVCSVTIETILQDFVKKVLGSNSTFSTKQINTHSWLLQIKRVNYILHKETIGYLENGVAQ